ncbi:phosphate ABC transporter substrate-binding protein, PhoT family (TC 3.A.1.7.1) [Streptomyces sp. cf386]|uniref:substrate-binding domain-containing protein n=1 Tax=Streptomyces sp. cf386 TaxID=1761904 RepID=UPI00088466FE|nr:substrate-binding domain-containing protein [Streptomyces sp. cf386]SDM69069.1 phosphate ABC transporter substrate-binding protein, PhoT family (TC 3.A.1.7.1) [Streptomyces sp. cf386]
MSERLEQWIAIVSLAIPLAAFLWEFAVVGRKRLGYRVQMDTLASDDTQSEHAEILTQLQRDGHQLKDPSFVLLRIENAGSAPIEPGDYLTDEHDHSGIWVTFRRRQVAGLVVTELSQPELRRFFRRGAQGFGFSNDETRREGVIELPKAKLPRRAEYKVLVILEAWHDDPSTERFPKPDIIGAVGTDRRWFDPLAKYFRFKVARTESHVFASRPAWWGICFLTAAVVIQASFTLFLRDDRRPPLDCVAGTLHLHGSTAFEPAVRAAAADYLKRCEGADVSIPLADDTFEGSRDGATALDNAGEKAGIKVGEGLGDHIAFSDGLASDGHPRLIPKPVALSVFTLVVNKGAGVENLTLGQIRQIFAGRVQNWSEVGGDDVPVQLVNRSAGSGTRSTLVTKLLNNKQPPQFTETDCASLNAKKYGRCEVSSTDSMLNATASTPGAIGYSEVTAVDGHKVADRLVKPTIDGRKPTAEGVEDTNYPYWQTEFAYTYGEAPAGSVAAAFLNFLTQQSGRDILRDHGHGLCSEVQNSGECRPL